MMMKRSMAAEQVGEQPRPSLRRLAELRAWVAVLRDEVRRRRGAAQEVPALSPAERRMLLTLCGDD